MNFNENKITGNIIVNGEYKTAFSVAGMGSYNFTANDLKNSAGASLNVLPAVFELECADKYFLAIVNKNKYPLSNIWNDLNIYEKIFYKIIK